MVNKNEVDMPVSWIATSLDEVVDSIVGGGTPSKSNPSFYAGDIPWMSVKDMNKDVLVDTIDHITQEAVDNSSTNIIPAGTPIVATRMSLGKIVLANFDSAINQDLKAIFVNSQIDRKFFVYWYRSLGKLIESLGTGTTVKGIRLEVLKELEFPLPPLPEQKQIAATLDQLLARVEAIKTRLDAIPALLKRFRQSVLAAAVSGRLTEEWRDNNQNSNKSLQQLAEIEQDRLAIITKKKKPERYLTNELYAIPEQWTWTSLDSLSAKIVDGTHHTPTYTESGVPFISVKDIRKGKINFSNTKYISKEEHAELRKRCPVARGDLLITKSGTIGRTAIVDTDEEFSLFVSVALIKPASELVNIKFVNIALQKWVNEIDVSNRIVGSAIKNLHLRDMRVLAVPFPQVEEQTQIVHRVEQLFAFADQIEQRLAAARGRVDHLTQSILAKAFRGELTAQWRADHPELISGEHSAQALLDRIKAERAAAPVKKRSRKKRP